MQFNSYDVLAFVFSCGLLCALTKIALTLINRKSVSDALPPDDVVARLDRIERAVETTAVEVERVGEGLRFLTRLSSPTPRGAVEAGRAPVRVITPH